MPDFAYHPIAESLDCLLWFAAGALSTKFMTVAWCKIETWVLRHGQKT